MTRWYVAFAAAVAVASGQPVERCWGTWAAIGYATAARWGYCAYPVALLGWLSLSRPPGRRSYSSERALVTPSASAAVPAGVASTGADAVPASG